MNAKKLIISILIIVFCFYAKCQTNYYFSEEREIMLTNDSTSVNIIVNNMENYAEIAQRLAILFPDSGSVIYDDEDDNIIVNSSKLLELTKDSIIRFIQIDSNDILFFTYSKLTDNTSNKIWLRNEVLVGLKEGYNISDISNLYSQYETLGVVDEGNNDYIIQCKTESDVLNLSNLLYTSGYVDYAHPDFYSQVILSSTINDPLYPYQFYLKNTGQYITSSTLKNILIY
ncbi:MAG: hypothetical protein ACOXZH_05930 [Bacteroidales bacterium]|jgi:hypothetical protein